jgi:hypothetical protein
MRMGMSDLSITRSFIHSVQATSAKSSERLVTALSDRGGSCCLRQAVNAPTAMSAVFLFI